MAFSPNDSNLRLGILSLLSYIENEKPCTLAERHFPARFNYRTWIYKSMPCLILLWAKMGLKTASGKRQRPPAGFLRRPAHLIASGFGIGLVRFAPGTFGTLIGVGLYFGMAQLPLAYYGGTVSVLFLLGIFVCGRTAVALGVHDDPSIVWDEVVGYLITMTAVPPQWIWVAVGFALFRIFDILKPWPVRAIDQHVGGGFGVMLDDALAGAYASIGVQTAMFLTQ